MSRLKWRDEVNDSFPLSIEIILYEINTRVVSIYERVSMVSSHLLGNVRISPLFYRGL